jgi:hypothetical protein
MRIVLKPEPTTAQLVRALRYIRSLGKTPFVCQDGRTVLGLCAGPSEELPKAIQGSKGSNLEKGSDTRRPEEAHE